MWLRNEYLVLILFFLWCHGKSQDKSLLLGDKGFRSQSLALPEIYSHLKTKILTKETDFLAWN